MTVIVEIPEDIEARLRSEAEESGVPLPQLVRDVLIDHFEEVADREVAESRLKDRQAPVSASEMRRTLGLDN